MIIRVRPAVVLVLALAATTAVSVRTASAQPTDPAAEAGTRRSQSSLDVLVDLFGAVDNAFGVSEVVPLGPITGPAVASSDSRSYWGGNSSLSYEKTSGRSTTFNAELGASVRRFTAVSDDLQPGYTGNIGGAGRLGRRARWQARQGLSWGPSNATPFFSPGDPSGGGVVLPIVDYSLATRNQFVTSSLGTLSYSVSRRGSISGSVDYSRSGAITETDPIVPETPQIPEAPADPADPDVAPPLGASVRGAYQRLTLSGRYSHATTRYLTWYGGYGSTLSGIDTADSPQVGQIDAGFSYARPLGFSRRTRISTTFGSSIIQQRSGGRRQWRANGAFSLRHELGRTWQTQFSYYRDTRFVPTFVDPILADTLTASVGGSLSRRSSLNALANYSKGTVGLSTGANGYRMTSASGSYRYAFVSQMAAYVEYFLFDFRFDSGVPLGDSVLNNSKRHGVRFGVSIGTGLMGTRRRSPLPGGENAQ